MIIYVDIDETICTNEPDRDYAKAKPINIKTPTMMNGRILGSVYFNTGALLVRLILAFGDCGRNRQTKRPFKNARTAISHKGKSSEKTASPLSAGPKIEPRLLAAPEAPIPLVRFSTVVISAM